MNNTSDQVFSSTRGNQQPQAYSEATMMEIGEKTKSRIIEQIKMEMAKEASSLLEGEAAATPLMASTGTYVKIPYVKTPYVKIPYAKLPYVKI